MFKRMYSILGNSCLILGPRGVGKSTFVLEQVQPALIIDLLKAKTFRELQMNPSLLEDQTAHLKKNETVFIDEIQKIPSLLDEVHRLIETKKIHFIMTGSSARKLRQSGTNLLAGRALGLKMFPLTLKELNGTQDILDVLKFGTLPTTINQRDIADEYLASYVDLYLKEEVFQESLTRNLEAFSHFIEIAGQYHGQLINFENIGREIAISGDTIKSWFQILIDTLVGRKVEAYPTLIFPKQMRHSKFYFFDSGIAWAATGQSFKEIPTEYKGFQFESLILNEVLTYLEVSRKKYRIFHFSVSQKGDVDFLIQRKKKSFNSAEELISLEVKASRLWKNGSEKLSMELKSALPKTIARSLAVYLGQQRLTKGSLEIFPIQEFVESLWSGELI
ncbi:MAG: ATP-binding protein [Pseudobdellovibrionaceae bacterium]